MADANARRQRRHDRCKATTACPKCGAPPVHPCYGPVREGNGHVYPAKVMRHEIERAAMSLGKTMATTAHIAGRFMRSDWGKPIGGLHRERWDAWEPTAIERLGDLADDE